MVAMWHLLTISTPKADKVLTVNTIITDSEHALAKMAYTQEQSISINEEMFGLGIPCT